MQGIKLLGSVLRAVIAFAFVCGAANAQAGHVARTPALVAASGGAGRCDFNAPGRAKLIQMWLVPRYEECVATFTFPGPNDSASTGIASCSPPRRTSSYRFGPHGACKLSVKQSIESICKDPFNGAPCADIQVRLKCSGILDSHSEPIDGLAGGGWLLDYWLRLTMNETERGDQTLIDFPFSFYIVSAKRGVLILDSTINALLAGFFGPGVDLPPCTTASIVNLALRDPDGEIFAVPGSSTR